MSPDISLRVVRAVTCVLSQRGIARDVVVITVVVGGVVVVVVGAAVIVRQMLHGFAPEQVFNGERVKPGTTPGHLFPAFNTHLLFCGKLLKETSKNQNLSSSSSFVDCRVNANVRPVEQAPDRQFLIITNKS
jgi:hypothetical protein